MNGIRLIFINSGYSSLPRVTLHWRAREAITHISSERRFRGRFDIEIIAWDQPGAAVAMEAGLTSRQAIAQGLPKPEDCDLAVIILWLRIGTQLPAELEWKEDGAPYLSGTEWEYLNALKGSGLTVNRLFGYTERKERPILILIILTMQPSLNSGTS